MRARGTPVVAVMLLSVVIASCNGAKDSGGPETATPTSEATGARTSTPAASGTTSNAASPTATPAGTVGDSAAPTPTPARTATDAASPTPTPTPTAEAQRGAVASPASRLASHLFVAAGESRSIRGLGELLEVIDLTEPAAVDVQGEALTAVQGGIACLRFAYRTSDAENGVQTLCVVVFDETGDCTGLPSLQLDLQRFLEPEPQPVGNANLLEWGEGDFYAVCESGDGAYRLQQTRRALPPLYFTIVDALGDGPYSLGSGEMEMQRAGLVTTYSGDELRPPWIVPVSLEPRGLRVTDDLSVEFQRDDCSVSPACTLDPDIVRPGDLLLISAALSPQQVGEAFEDLTETQRSAFFQDRIGVGWEEMTAVHPDALQMAFMRLVALDVMSDVVTYFDSLYDLRGKGVVAGWSQPWPAQTRLPFPFACFPDSIVPGETARCTRIEQAIQEAEAERIEELKLAGFDLWHAGSVSYGDQGYLPEADVRPHFSIFDGVLATIAANSSASVADIPGALAHAMREFAAELGPAPPVIISLNGPPLTAQTGGAFCEAEICPSDFRGMYAQTEAALGAALDAFAPGQLEGFGVTLFEGSHFDIRQPYEDFGGFSLNRVGETGYNNPVLNIYRAQ